MINMCEVVNTHVEDKNKKLEEYVQGFHNQIIDMIEREDSFSIIINKNINFNKFSKELVKLINYVSGDYDIKLGLTDYKFGNGNYYISLIMYNYYTDYRIRISSADYNLDLLALKKREDKVYIFDSIEDIDQMYWL